VSANPTRERLEREAKQRGRERYLSALSDMLSGGLLVDTKNGYDLPPERALMRAAGAMLKAVTLAKFNGSVGQDDLEWTNDSTELSDDETHAALSAIGAILRNAPDVFSHLRARGEFRESDQRSEPGNDGGAS
jgi:hypothetical protein